MRIDSRKLPNRKFLWCLAFLCVAATHAEPAFKDPAPPGAQPLRELPAPVPQPNPDTTFHAAPKPLAPGAVTSDWPCFLGPTHNAFSPETRLLKQLAPAGPPVVWEMTKGEGYAAPAIAGERLILFHRVKDDEVVDCLDTMTGQRYWRFSYPTKYRDRYGYCNGPRSSPAIDGEAVFVIGAEGRFHCLDLKTGQIRWKRDLVDEFKLRQNFFGIGASPLVEGGMVIVNLGADGGPCVAAFDARTGKMVWGAGSEWGPSYATPVPAFVRGRRRVLVFAGGESRPPTGGLLCIDPATGKVDFTFPWRGTRAESVNASSPVIAGDQVFVSECYGSGSAMLDLLPDSKFKVAWTNPGFGTHFMTAIPKDGFLYGVDGHGPQDAFLGCLDLKTGKEQWRTQPEWEEKVEAGTGGRTTKFGTYRAFLIEVDGSTLCLGEYGHLLWIALSPEGYKELSRSRLFLAQETWTPPAISRGLLYVNQNSRGALTKGPPRLICYDLRAAE